MGRHTSFTGSVNALAKHFLACVDFVFVLEAQLAAQDSPGWTLDRQHGEVDAKESDDLQVYLRSGQMRAQCAITQLKLLTDQFAFADSMPRDARARPMRAQTLWCRGHRHHRHRRWQYAIALQA